MEVEILNKINEAEEVIKLFESKICLLECSNKYFDDDESKFYFEIIGKKHRKIAKLNLKLKEINLTNNNMSFKVNGFEIKKSNKKDKKYDVFDSDGKYVVSFGSASMQHYFDQFGLYSHLNHNDEDRLKSFRKRFNKVYEKNKNNPRSGIYWSYNYLW